jgi:hypothetical protein
MQSPIADLPFVDYGNIIIHKDWIGLSYNKRSAPRQFSMQQWRREESVLLSRIESFSPGS